MAYSTYQAKNGVGVTGCFGGSFVYHGIGGNGYECPNMDDYYTKVQCDEKFALKGEGGSGGSVDLTNYATKEELNTKIQEVEAKIPENQDLSNYALKSELPDLSTYALKTELPEEVDLNPYALKSELPDLSPYALKTEIFSLPQNVQIQQLLNDQGIMFHGTTSTFSLVRSENQTNQNHVFFTFKDTKPVHISDAKIGTFLLGFSTTYAFTAGTKLKHFTSEQSPYLDTPVDYVTTEDLANQSQTVTHLCPISEEHTIEDFIVGAPVYLTGKVFKKIKDEWFPTTKEDSIDCISSVKTNGNWKEYLGICTSKTDKEIRFASHGDFLVKVSDSSTFGVGDSTYIEDVEHEGKIIPVLKILSDNIPLTSKIQRTTVGIVTAIIDESTISVFRE